MLFRGDKKVNAALENIKRDMRMRTESDPQMSNAWLLVYLLPVIVSVVTLGYSIVLFLSLFSRYYPFTSPYDYPFNQFAQPFLVSWIGFLITMILFVVVYIVLIYKLVNRRNTHFTRQKFLSEDVIVTIKSLAEKKKIDVDVNLSSIERTVREANAEETKKDAVLWAVLSAFIPFVSWFVHYFLMKDFYHHERREDGFWEDLNGTLNKLGVSFSVPRRTQAMPNRSFVLYLILTIITLGLFGIYWIYVLLKDPNEHFKHHVETENQLLTALESA